LAAARVRRLAGPLIETRNQEERMSASYHANLELILIDWLGAHRDHGLERLAELLDPDVEQRWVDGKVYCANRDQLLAWKAALPRHAEYLLDGVEALRGDDEHVVLGVHGAHVEAVGGVHVGGHLYEVFTIRDGRIVAIRAYLRRDEALAAAGAPPGSAAWR
jgi:ketosteroid isomerase-like protein